MDYTANKILLRGELAQLPAFSHENHGRRFFRCFYTALRHLHGRRQRGREERRLVDKYGNRLCRGPDGLFKGIFFGGRCRAAEFLGRFGLEEVLFGDGNIG